MAVTGVLTMLARFTLNLAILLSSLGITHLAHHHAASLSCVLNFANIICGLSSSVLSCRLFIFICICVPKVHVVVRKSISVRRTVGMAHHPLPILSIL